MVAAVPAFSKFLGTPGHPGIFRAVQVLSALVIGSPDFAKAVVGILDQLDKLSEQTLSELPELLPTSSNPIWQETAASLAAFAVEDNPRHPPSLCRCPCTRPGSRRRTPPCRDTRCRPWPIGGRSG